jgi:hypothetical protein
MNATLVPDEATLVLDEEIIYVQKYNLTHMWEQQYRRQNTV